MSKLVAFAAIQGAYNIVSKGGGNLQKGPRKIWPGSKDRVSQYRLLFTDHLFHPGITVKTLGEAQKPLEVARKLLPPHVKNMYPPALSGALAGCRDGGPFCRRGIGRHPLSGRSRFLSGQRRHRRGHGKIWLGAAEDTVFRKRGVEFVDGTAPGFAAIVGAAPDPETAKKIAEEYQKKNLYVFMCANQNGTTFSEQLLQAGVQIGWNTRLVPFGPDISAAVFALGFANRAAMAFGGIKPGDYKKMLLYKKDRIFAFVNALGDVDAEWAANAAGCVNWGFPTIADTDIPEILPTGVCTYEHVVANVPHREMPQRSIEIRGLKVTVAKMDIPLAYGPAFEGERVRKEDLYLEMGGGKTQATELVQMAEMNAIEDGKVEVVGPDVDDIKKGDACLWGSTSRWPAVRCRRILSPSWSGRSIT